MFIVAMSKIVPIVVDKSFKKQGMNNSDKSLTPKILMELSNELS